MTPDSRSYLLGVLALQALILQGLVAQVRITEFVATGSALEDEDGDTNDWIELRNISAEAVDLSGWTLNDRLPPAEAWVFPSVLLGAGEYIVVFASGKDRADPAGELHTHFRLEARGEYLVLHDPSGQVAQEFSPAFPPQREGLSFGDSGEVNAALIATTADARLHVPANDSLAGDWTGDPLLEPFDDSTAAGWRPVRMPIGFDARPQDGADGPLAYWNFDDAETPRRASDSSQNGVDGVIGSQLALRGAGGSALPTYTAAGGGHTGAAGDRALDFGPSGNGAIVDIPAAADGAFDRAVSQNAISISLWTFGGASQPSGDSLFWGASGADGSGTRSLNAHAPWSDGVIYWDVGGCCDGSTRIQRAAESPARFRGEWNHYVFVKDAEHRAIWINGELFHEGGPGAPLTTIRQLTLGGSVTSLTYGGLLDDVAIWDRALGAGEIERLALGASPLALSRLEAFIETDIADDLLDVNSSAFLRIPFEADAALDVDVLRLSVRYDDGFIAYLNGEELLRRNAAGAAEPRFDASARDSRDIFEALRAETIDLTPRPGLLLPGRNVLAVQVLNAAVDDPDLLFALQLFGVRSQVNQFLVQPTPGAANSPGAPGFVADTRFEPDRGYYDAPFEVAVSSATPDATILYTLDGSQPTDDNPSTRTWTGPLSIDGTTMLRAVAVREGWIPSNTDTHTYIFAADVAEQPRNPPGHPTTWSGGFPSDYAMDPDVVDSTLAGYGIEEALLSIPTVSLVAPHEDIWSPERGIYYSTAQKTERRGSFELFDAAGDESFQIDAGLRIHGLTSRRHDFTPKHSFRILFQRQFGPPKLRQRVFPDSRIDRFDQLVLRGMSTDSWCVQDGWRLGQEAPGSLRWYRRKAQYLREQWMKDSMGDMGQPTTHGRFVHVVLNGLYWGVYHLTERPTNTHLSEHDDLDHGLRGDEQSEREDYDIIKDFAELHSGSDDAWDEAMSLANGGLGDRTRYQRIQGNRPDGSRDLSLPRLVDLDNLIDFMILHIYAGADDWPNHNWWGGRYRHADEDTSLRGSPLDSGFRFFVWDQEISLQSLTYSHTSWGPLFEEVGAPNTPSFLYSRMRSNPDFRRQFADRVHELLFNGGAMSPEKNIERLLERATEIDHAIVAESARWGDHRRSLPFKREVEWLTEQRWLVERYFPEIHDIVLERFRRVDLYPDVEAPIIAPHGGRVDGPVPVDIAAPAGVVWYTLDGSDPRDEDGGVSADAIEAGRSPRVTILSRGDLARVHVPGPADAGLEWTQPDFDDGTWRTGPTGVGYEQSNGYEELIGTDVSAEMFETLASVWIRIEIDSVSAVPGSLSTLRMQYDDGFVAWLNGVEIARVNAPEDLTWDAAATSSNPDSQALRFEEFPLPAGVGLRAGRNVLAIHGLNTRPSNLDLLFVPELDVQQIDGAGLQIEATSTVTARALVDGEWSARTRAEFHGSESHDLRITEIMYHPPPDFSRPIDENEFEFLELQNVGTRSIPLRGLRLTGEVDFDFDRAEIDSLLPGEAAVLVRNRVAFRERYPGDVLIAGVYQGQLQNAGGELTLLDALGATILEFEFDDVWYPETDGAGFSLVIRDPLIDRALWGDSMSWTSSAEPGGTPGIPQPLEPAGGRRVGDINGDDDLNLSDAVLALTHLFGGTERPLPCDAVSLEDAGVAVLFDINGDGQANLSDPISMLGWLFLGDPPPAGGIDCRSLPNCEEACAS